MKRVLIFLLSVVLLVAAVFPAAATALTSPDSYSSALTGEKQLNLLQYAGTTQRVKLFDVTMTDKTDSYEYSLYYLAAENLIKLYKKDSDSSPAIGGFNSANEFFVAGVNDCFITCQSKKLAVSFEGSGGIASCIFISISSNDNYELIYSNFSGFQPFEEEQTTAPPVTEQITEAPVTEVIATEEETTAQKSPISEKMVDLCFSVIIVLLVVIAVLVVVCILLIILLVQAKRKNENVEVKHAQKKNNTAKSNKTEKPRSKGQNTKNSAQQPVKKQNDVSEADSLISDIKQSEKEKKIDAPEEKPEPIKKSFIEEAKEKLLEAYKNGTEPAINFKYAERLSLDSKITGKPLVKEYTEGKQAMFIFFTDNESNKIYLAPNPCFYNENRHVFSLTNPQISDYVGVQGSENGKIVNIIPSVITPDKLNIYTVTQKGFVSWR